jgi:hypothetical protein
MHRMGKEHRVSASPFHQIVLNLKVSALPDRYAATVKVLVAACNHLLARPLACVSSHCHSVVMAGYMNLVLGSERETRSTILDRTQLIETNSRPRPPDPASVVLRGYEPCGLSRGSMTSSF